MLALIAERASGMPFHELVRQRVCEPAGMPDTEFLRSDELPGRAALGYLEIDGPEDQRLPPTGARERRRRDLLDRWPTQLALEGVLRRSDRVAGIGSARWCAPAATSPRADRYGLGFWLHASTDTVMWWAATRASRSAACTPRAPQVTHTVISNTSDGAWPITEYLDDPPRHLTERKWAATLKDPKCVDFPSPANARPRTGGI